MYLVFNNFNILCLDVAYFVFILLEVYRDSWICGLTTFVTLGKFLSSISSHSASALFFFFQASPEVISSIVFEREWKGERKRKREREKDDVRETHWPPPTCSWLGGRLRLQLRYMLLTGIESMALQSMGQCSKHWAKGSRAAPFSFFSPSGTAITHVSHVSCALFCAFYILIVF